MKTISGSIITILIALTCVSPAFSQVADAQAKFKKHINSIVKKVEQAETADKKREILDTSLQKLTDAMVKVEKMDRVSESDKEGIAHFRKTIEEKKNELNGTDGFVRVPDSELNNFANYMQQDLEQADKKITLSLTVVLLVVIILLLL